MTLTRYASLSRPLSKGILWGLPLAQIKIPCLRSQNKEYFILNPKFEPNSFMASLRHNGLRFEAWLPWGWDKYVSRYLGTLMWQSIPNKIRRVWNMCTKTQKNLLVAYLKPKSMLPCLHK
jgi:hypothetical protein